LLDQMLNRALSVAMLFIAMQFISGCAIKKMAVNSVADALADSNSDVFASDNDPQFVGEALPFALKTIESVLQAAPKHEKLLIAATSGFVQYGHAYVLRPAETLESIDFAAARKGKKRAKQFFLRARDYGLRALELGCPGISTELRKQPVVAAKRCLKEDVAALYWTGVAWGSALSVGKSDMALVGELPIVTALMERALALDESWGDGAIHDFFIIFDAGRSKAEGGGMEQAEKHFQRAMELNGGQSISPLVSLAESVCIQQQDLKRFKKLLKQVLAFEADTHPENRLSNLLAQDKAKQLLDNIDEFFFLSDE